MHRKIFYTLLLVLFLLHQDFWFKGDPSMLFGFLPVTFGWHIGFSVAASLLWAYACSSAWPTSLEESAEEDQPEKDNP